MGASKLKRNGVDCRIKSGNDDGNVYYHVAAFLSQDIFPEEVL